MIGMEIYGIGSGKMNDYNEVVHLLGYVTVEQWADVLHDHFSFNKEIIYELMRIQERVYKTDLIVQVEAIIETQKRAKEKRWKK